MKISNILAAGVLTVMLGASASAFACHLKGGEGHDGDHHGGWMHHEDGDHHQMGAMGGPMGNLSPEHRELFMKSMHASHEKDMALMRQMHEQHEKLEAELRAPRFNKAGFLATSNHLASLQSQLAHNHTTAFANLAAKLTPEERASFAMMGPMHHGMMHHDGMHGEQGHMMHHNMPGADHNDMGRTGNDQRHDYKLND